ncbi:cold shock protein 2-like [Carica papaya]|uniref:cold shock protein 2-like n=1 Tax=Carica papaya TaxID=3649 RepID=UPI000B8CE257|nr:cold shock protein 2-like [Carica papaya]
MITPGDLLQLPEEEAALSDPFLSYSQPISFENATDDNLQKFRHHDLHHDGHQQLQPLKCSSCRSSGGGRIDYGDGGGGGGGGSGGDTDGGGGGGGGRGGGGL